MRAWLIALLLCAGPLGAQDLPALYDVTGVADDDVLNVRAAPDAAEPALGFFASDAEGIEVVQLGPNGQWGLVNLAERAGWVNLQFLKRRPVLGDGVPRDLRCFGTEPFWSLGLDGDATTLSIAGAETWNIGPARWLGSENRTGIWAVEVDGEPARMTGFVARRICGDGMSDRAYGLSMDLLLHAGESQRVLSGCCTLAE